MNTRLRRAAGGELCTRRGGGGAATPVSATVARSIEASGVELGAASICTMARDASITADGVGSVGCVCCARVDATGRRSVNTPTATLASASTNADASCAR